MAFQILIQNMFIENKVQLAANAHLKYSMELLAALEELAVAFVAG